MIDASNESAKRARALTPLFKFQKRSNLGTNDTSISGIVVEPQEYRKTAGMLLVGLWACY